MIEAANLEADIYPAGPRGLSAYEIYKKEGGQLSEEEWLKSLNGLTPTIGENGNWFLGTVDTGLPSRGPKGDTGSIKFIVVTELPTENIDETAIYMKPAKNLTGENNFEELIYVNGKWEDLGTPSVGVDLSDYYTKEETTKLIDSSLKKYYLTSNLPISKWNGISYSLNDVEQTSIHDILKDAYNNNHKSFEIILLNSSKDYKTPKTMTLFCNEDITQKPTHIQIYSDILGGTDGTLLNQSSLTSKFFSVSINIYLSWSDDDFTFSSGTGMTCSSFEILRKDNLYPYTPTADYHPATKKYVDDNVKTYTAGDNITISEDNVISASGGDINDVGIYTWVYSDFPNTTNYDLKTKYNDFFKNMVNDAYSKGKKGIILTKTGNSTSGLNNKYQYTFTALNCDLQLKPTIIALYGTPLTTSMNFYQRVNFQYAQIRIGGTWTDNTFEPQYIYWDGITTVSFLSVDNMWNYTPTNNYNPSTKLYTDKTHYEKMTGYDATKTQVLKNINGTLTWVDEA